LDDSFRSNLGNKIIEILDACDMVKKKLIKKKSAKESNQILEVIGKDFGLKTSERIMALPTKLPMIVKPKEYSKNVSGGYLLNDDKFYESLFIEKKAYGINSRVSDDNKIYDMINNINSTPFRINETLLDFLQDYGYEHDLLIDGSVKHKFSEIEKRTRYQETVLIAHNSKLLLQENIIVIAQLFVKFPVIYFPVRLDQRGRLYCTSNFLNYQSSELSKSLLLFAEPSPVPKEYVHSKSKPYQIK
jgi:DNA-directed RNA polymerase